ncbi:hypothetical protein GWP40_08590 [Treponema vincentii]|uniref:hypothetical protein n=1 Tax=Treponema vincentii TaxID=69710 RepID=UPI001BB01F01|nr:hypothetical protein [Treponema vincentii]QUY18365.1 hypothetical protein GWP40_08590 [Treponema vincentii]
MTYKEYRDAVKNQFLKLWNNLTEQEVESYFKREGEKVIQSRYECLSSTDEGVRGTGSIDSVAYCLYMMYE